MTGIKTSEMGKRYFAWNRLVFWLAIIILNSIFSNLTLAQGKGDKEIGITTASGLLLFKDKSGERKIVHTKAQWKEKRRQILDSMQQVMGKLPDRSNLPPLDIKVTDTYIGSNFTRLKISFAVAANERVPAFLYIPFQKNKTSPEKRPAMLVLHGTGAKGKQLVDSGSYSPNHAQARELAQRGYVVIAPDYPSFGELTDYNFETDRYESGTMKGIFNHMRCIDLLQSREDVDPKCIGALGLSLGGHNSMFVGAFDERIKVVVSACGWTLFDYYNAGDEVTKRYGGKLGPWAQTRYMPLFRDKYKLDAASIPFDFDEVIAAIAPRVFFSVSCLNDANFDVKGVVQGIAQVKDVYRFLKSEGNLQVRYPVAQHDFPPEARLEAYRFIDKMFKHKPSIDGFN